MRKWVKRIAKALLIFVVLLAVFLYFYVVFPLWGVPFNAQRHGNPPLVPAWALECWLWEDDYITESALLEHLNGYIENDLPVRTYLIDCPWATRFNDFTFDETRFPHPREMLDGLHKRGIRVALWMSTMVNSKSDDCAIKDSKDWFADAAQKGYLAGGDYQWRWWLGKGGFIDYTNPDAMKWWHGLQDQVLDLGIDAWKLDDTASFFTSRPLGALAFYQKTHEGWLTTREYMDHFYRDEYKYALSKNPEFVTMSRPIDSVLPWGHPEGFSPIDASPINWVGDNTHTWAYETRGIERAIRCILDSAKLGYNLIGSDTGGYHGENIIPADLYIRWAEFSAFCGFFLNGGHGERRLWLRTPKELELIREYSWLHTELVPYMYCSVVEAHNGGKRLMRPMREGKYQYGFGDWLVVAPMYTPSEEREVTLPEGAWRYWFDDAKTINGGTTFKRSYPLDEYPVFVRDGAIIPMNISREYTGVGERDWAGLLTLNIYPAGDSSFEIPHTDRSGSLKVSVHDGNPTIISLDGAAKPHILRILSMNKPKSVERNGVPLVEGKDWNYLSEKKRLIVRSDTAINSKCVIAY